MEVFKNSSRPDIISRLSDILDILLALFILRKLRQRKAFQCRWVPQITASAEVPWEVGGAGWQSCSKRNRDLELKKERAARWEERAEEGGERGPELPGGRRGQRREEREAQQELCPILRVAGFPSTVACCIVKYDNAGYSDRLSISHLKFTFKDWFFYLIYKDWFFNNQQNLSKKAFFLECRVYLQRSGATERTPGKGPKALPLTHVAEGAGGGGAENRLRTYSHLFPSTGKYCT